MAQALAPSQCGSAGAASSRAAVGPAGNIRASGPAPSLAHGRTQVHFLHAQAHPGEHADKGTPWESPVLEDRREWPHPGDVGPP